MKIHSLIPGLAIALTASGPTHPPSRLTDVKGVWSDACPCQVPCSCWKTHKANVPECTNIHLYAGLNGTYHGLPIRDAHFVIVNTSKAVGQAPLASTLYLDERLDSVSRTAVIQMVGRMYRHQNPQIVSSPLRYRVSADRHEVEIDHVLQYSVSAPPPAGRPAAVVADHLYSWLRSPTQGTATFVRYQWNGRLWTYKGTNGLIASVRYREPAGWSEEDDPGTEAQDAPPFGTCLIHRVFCHESTDFPHLHENDAQPGG